MTKSTFQRFVDYTTEDDRIIEQQRMEAAKVTALKKITCEKSKTWDSKIEVRLIYFHTMLQSNKKIFNSTKFRNIYLMMYFTCTFQACDGHKNQSVKSCNSKQK